MGAGSDPVISLATYGQAVGALLLVLAMIGGIAFILRRIGFGGIPRVTGRNKRLTVLESLAVDPRNRLILVRHDEREHLLLVGQETALLVASDAATDATLTSAAQTGAAQTSTLAAGAVKAAKGDGPP